MRVFPIAVLSGFFTLSCGAASTERAPGENAGSMMEPPPRPVAEANQAATSPSMTESGKTPAAPPLDTPATVDPSVKPSPNASTPAEMIPPAPMDPPGVEMPAEPKVGEVVPLPPGGTWEVDLTKGSPGPNAIEVTGGKFEDGWRVTSVLGDRIVWDMGRPLKEGIFEVSVTVNKHPNSNNGKIEWAGLYELAALDHDLDNDSFYARVGQSSYAFSRVKAGGTWFLQNGMPMTRGSEWEGTIGGGGDWKVDDKTIHTVKFEWKGGKAIFHDTKGGVHTCNSSICGGTKYGIDELRYVFVGADKWKRWGCDSPCDVKNISPVGMRFLKVRLTEYVAK
jgi:hypothetical protein